MSVTLKTKKLDFHFCSTVETQIFINGEKQKISAKPEEKLKFTSLNYDLPLTKDVTTTIYKYAANVTNRDHDTDRLETVGKLY